MSVHSTETPGLGYSYIRFSSPEQAKGDSLRRQTAKTEEWCQRNKIALDTTMSLRDAGVSAFRGKNRNDKFALGQFLKLVERGRIPKGSYLIVENLDRLSREEERPALRLWMDILDAGINIVQLVPETIFRHDNIDMLDIMRAIIELSRGRSESRMKSERVGKAWGERKRKTRKDGDTLTPTLPGWIEERNGKRCIKPGAAEAIRRLFKLAAQGYGEVRLTRLFQKERVPSFGKSKKWTQPYIRKLMRDRRLLGEFQPRIKATGEPDGEVIPNYLPAVITDAEFYAAQRGRDGRRTSRKNPTPIELQTIQELHGRGKTAGEIARQLGVSRYQIYRALIKLGLRERPSEAKPQGVYLFNGMVRSPDERRYVLGTWIIMDRPYKVLVLKGEKSVTFPYYVLERAILHELREINPKEVLDGANGHDEVAALQDEFDAVDAEVQTINADMDANGFSPSLGKRVRQLEARLAEIGPRLESAKQKAANPLSPAWGEAKALLTALDTAVDIEDARVRLRAALKRIVHSIYLHVVPKGRDRYCVIQLWFRTDAAIAKTAHVLSTVIDPETGEVDEKASEEGRLETAVSRTFHVQYRPRGRLVAGGWRVLSYAESAEEIEPHADQIEPGEKYPITVSLPDPVDHFAFADAISQQLGGCEVKWHPLPPEIATARGG